MGAGRQKPSLKMTEDDEKKSLLSPVPLRQYGSSEESDRKNETPAPDQKDQLVAAIIETAKSLPEFEIHVVQKAMADLKFAVSIDQTLIMMGFAITILNPKRFGRTDLLEVENTLENIMASPQSCLHQFKLRANKLKEEFEEEIEHSSSKLRTQPDAELDHDILYLTKALDKVKLLETKMQTLAKLAEKNKDPLDKEAKILKDEIYTLATYDPYKKIIKQMFTLMIQHTRSLEWESERETAMLSKFLKQGILNVLDIATTTGFTQSSIGNEEVDIAFDLLLAGADTEYLIAESKSAGSLLDYIKQNKLDTALKIMTILSVLALIITMPPAGLLAVEITGSIGAGKGLMNFLRDAYQQWQKNQDELTKLINVAEHWAGELTSDKLGGLLALISQQRHLGNEKINSLKQQLEQLKENKALLKEGKDIPQDQINNIEELGRKLAVERAKAFGGKNTLFTPAKEEKKESIENTQLENWVKEEMNEPSFLVQEVQRYSKEKLSDYLVTRLEDLYAKHPEALALLKNFYQNDYSGLFTYLSERSKDQSTFNFSVIDEKAAKTPREKTILNQFIANCQLLRSSSYLPTKK